MYQVPFRLVLMTVFPAFHGEIDRSLWKLSAGAVDENVKPAVRSPDRVEQGADRVGFPDVGGAG